MNQSEQKQKAILDATFTLLNQKEIKDITIEEIAKKAVVSKVTIFKHFQNKNRLINVVILGAFKFMAQQVEDIIQSNRDFEATYRAITDMKLEQVQKFTPTFQQNIMTQFTNSPDFFDLDAQTTQMDIYMHLLEKGRAEGRVSPAITDDDFLFLVRIFTEGMKGLDADVLFQKTDFITNFFVNGLRQ